MTTKTLDNNLYVVQLTSLRGIACMVVLVGHVIQVINYRNVSAGWAVNWLSRLIRGSFNAEGAVLVFFVLSGCVLSLSLRNITRFDSRTVLGFYVKRVFRLYPLLWLSLIPAAFGMVVSTHLAKHGILADWLAGNIVSGISIRHSLYSFTGLYTRYNGPMWSLRIELIASVLFPAIYLLIRNDRYRAATLLGLAILALLPISHRLGTAFGLSFAVGALIPMLPYRATRFDIPLLWLALLVLVYDRLALAGLNPPERVFDMIETLAAFVIVRDIFTAGQRYRLLLAPPVVMLGEISFSVYLLHLPIFLILFAGISHLTGVAPLLNHPAISQLSLSILTALVTVLISIFTYKQVELPMHNLGRQISKRMFQTDRAERTARQGAAVPKAEPPLA